MASEKKNNKVAEKSEIRRIVSYEKLTAEQRALFDKEFPDNIEDFAQRFPKPNGDFFYAIPFKTEDAYFLVKVEVKIDSPSDDEDEFISGEDEPLDNVAEDAANMDGISEMSDDYND